MNLDRARRWILAGLVALAAGAPARASAQAGVDRGDLARQLEGRVPEGVRAGLTGLVDSLAATGIPAAALASKVLEGVGKGADSARIAAAVRRLGGDLAAARGALGTRASDAEVAAGADALRAGVAPDVLAQLKQARGQSSALIPLATLTDLVSRGVPVDRASSTVLALARARAADISYREAQQRAASAISPVSPEPGAPAAAHPPAPPPGRGRGGRP